MADPAEEQLETWVEPQVVELMVRNSESGNAPHAHYDLHPGNSYHPAS